MTYTIAVYTVKNSCRWTEELSETFRVLFQKQIWEVIEASWFYYKNISRWTVIWTSKFKIFFVYSTDIFPLGKNLHIFTGAITQDPL